jgi:hypothetical protein
MKKKITWKNGNPKTEKNKRKKLDEKKTKEKVWEKNLTPHKP